MTCTVCESTHDVDPCPMCARPVCDGCWTSEACCSRTEPIKRPRGRRRKWDAKARQRIVRAYDEAAHGEKQNVLAAYGIASTTVHVWRRQLGAQA